MKKGLRMGLLLLAATATAGAATVGMHALRSKKLVPDAKAASPASGPIRAEGRVVVPPNARVVVGTERGGKLSVFTVAERSAVKKGDVVAVLDDSEDQAMLTEARARTREADVNVAYLFGEVNKSRRLVEAGAIPKDDLTRLQHQLDAAIAMRTAAATTVGRIGTTSEKTRIRAPIDGVVLERHADQGETVPPGAKLVTIADLSHLRVEAEVDELDASKVRLGAAAVVTADGLPGHVEGRVEEIPLAITPRRIRPEDPTRPTDTHVLLVKIGLSSAAELRLGQRVEVSLDR